MEDGPLLAGKRGPNEDARPAYRKLLHRLLETDLEKKDRVTKVFQFFFPWAIWILFATTTTVSLLLFYNWEVANGLLDIWIFYTVPPMGKEILIPRAINAGVPRVLAGFSTTVIDVCFSMFLIWNYDWVKKIPILGKKLILAEEKGRDRMRRSKIFKRMTFMATTLFVLVPFSGSGGIGGTIIGRIVGMRPYRVLAAVVVGSLIGSISYSFVARQILTVLEGNSIMAYIMNVSILNIIAVVVAVLLIRYVVKNPKLAAERSQEMFEKGLYFTETTINNTERRRKEAAERAFNRTKGTTENMRKLNRRIVEENLTRTVRPIERMGSRGKRMANRTREGTLRTFYSAQRATSRAIDKGMEIGMRTSSLPFELAHEVSMETIEMTREGVDEAKEVFIDTSDRISKAAKRPKEMFKEYRKKQGNDD